MNWIKHDAPSGETIHGPKPGIPCDPHCIVEVMQHNEDTDKECAHWFGWHYRSNTDGSPWGGNIVKWRLAQ